MENSKYMLIKADGDLFNEVPICFNAVPEDAKLININHISYSMYNLLCCPLKFYLMYIKGSKTFNRSVIIGIITHKCYEQELFKIKNDSFSSKRIFDFATDDFIISCIDYHVKRNSYKVDDIQEFNAHIIEKVRDNLLDKFIKDMFHLISKYKYTMLVEIQNDESVVSIMNSDAVLHTKSDIILYNDKYLEVIDIKTGNINKSQEDQLIFYAYTVLNALKLRGKPIPKYVKGKIFSTRFTSPELLFTYESEEIKTKMAQIILTLNSMYVSLGIVSSRHITYFVEKDIFGFGTMKLNSIYENIKGNFSVGVCKYCPLSYSCPLKKGYITKKFREMVGCSNERVFKFVVAK